MKIEEWINNNQKKVHLKNLDIFRFIFACLIVACHIIGSSANFGFNYNNFKFIYYNSSHLWMCVELFFIISGFCFIYTYKAKQNWLVFFKAKIIRLWPVMIFSILLFAICSLFKLVHLYLMEDLFTLFFLNGLRLANHTTDYQGLGNLHPLWFVSCLIYTLIIYRYIIENYGFKLFNLILLFIIPIGIWIHIDTPAYIYKCYTGTIDLCRALYGVGIGSIIAIVFIENKEKFEKIKKNILTSFVNKFFINLLEIGIFSYLIFGLICSSKDRLVEGDLIFLFIVLVLLFLLKSGLLSKKLDSNISLILGKYSYAIFCTHSFWVDIFKKYYFTDAIWNIIKTLPIQHPFIEILYFGFPMLISVLFGVFTYYVIEKPITKYLKQKYLLKCKE